MTKWVEQADLLDGTTETQKWRLASGTDVGADGGIWRDLLSSLHFFAFAAESSEADLLTQTSNGAAGVLSLRGLHSTLERQAPLDFSGNQGVTGIPGSLSVPLQFSGSLGRNLESEGTLPGRIWLAKKLPFLPFLNHLQVENNCCHVPFIC